MINDSKKNWELLIIQSSNSLAFLQIKWTEKLDFELRKYFPFEMKSPKVVSLQVWDLTAFPIIFSSTSIITRANAHIEYSKQWKERLNILKDKIQESRRKILKLYIHYWYPKKPITSLTVHYFEVTLNE